MLLIGENAATLFKKGHWRRRFPVNFVKFLETTFFIWATAFGLSSVNPRKKSIKELVSTILTVLSF